jgi:DNA-binding NarL/FixJ family response regulator
LAAAKRSLAYTAAMPPAVLIVEDDPRCRSAFADAVRAAPDLRLAGVAGDLPEGLRLLDITRPDVLLVDIGLPSGSGIDLIRHANVHLPQCETMVVTVFADDRAVLGCIEAGATGYLLKDSRSVDIVQEIRLLCDGGSPISPAIARRLLLRVGGRPGAMQATADTPASLSAQEQAVLAHSAKGYSYDETARLMGLSRHTVETYVKRIYRKLQVHSKTEALYEARQLGLVRD